LSSDSIFEASFRTASGVAEVIASKAPCGSPPVLAIEPDNRFVGEKWCHPVVIWTGHDAMRNALPASAGLKILKPRPPKSCLAITMANTDPMHTIHTGACGGTFMASRRPVSTADPSAAVILFLMINW
jgi:hypothetical protein